MPVGPRAARLFAVAHGGDPNLLLFQKPREQIADFTVVVDDEDMRERFQVTSLVISHDIASCFRIAHQAILLIRGEIVARGTPDQLANGESEAARDFILRSGVDVNKVTRVHGDA